jgi:hypothetical protein
MVGDRQGGAERIGAEEYGWFYIIGFVQVSLTRDEKCIIFFYHHRVVNNLSFTFGSDPTLVHYSLFCPHCRHVGVGGGGPGGEGCMDGLVSCGGPLCGW